MTYYDYGNGFPTSVGPPDGMVEITSETCQKSRVYRCLDPLFCRTVAEPVKVTLVPTPT